MEEVLVKFHPSSNNFTDIFSVPNLIYTHACDFFAFTDAVSSVFGRPEIDALRDSAHLALANHVVSRAGPVDSCDRLARLFLVPLLLRAIPSRFVETTFFGDSSTGVVGFADAFKTAVGAVTHD
jgi:hypothetical protein